MVQHWHTDTDKTAKGLENQEGLGNKRNAVYVVTTARKGKGKGNKN